MNLFIFDMDGVLLIPLGYYYALKETVRLAGLRSGYGEASLTDAQIAQFESLGISSEWHSSALCLAFMILQKMAGKNPDNGAEGNVALDLGDLFIEIANQPIQDSPTRRGTAALENLGKKYGVSVDGLKALVLESESIESSPTFNWFQELILGSDEFAKIYKKSAQFKTDSYLKLYDEPLLSKPMAEKLMYWVRRNGNGAGIMTMRPSIGLEGFAIDPDAQVGAELVGVAGLPIFGRGEIGWLAGKTGRHVEEFRKPAYAHALAVILAASGWTVADSLLYAARPVEAMRFDDLQHLNDSTITVFEDTSGGMVSVEEAGKVLKQAGLRIDVRKAGVTTDTGKQAALASIGAVMYRDINEALAATDVLSTD